MDKAHISGFIFDEEPDITSVEKALISIELEISVLRSEGTIESKALADALDHNIAAMKDALRLYKQAKIKDFDWEKELKKRVEVEIALRNIRERKRRN